MCTIEKKLSKDNFSNLRIDANQEPWSKVCHVHIHQLDDVKNEWGVGDGTCGIDGCNESADRFVDFH